MPRRVTVDKAQELRQHSQALLASNRGLAGSPTPSSVARGRPGLAPSRRRRGCAAVLCGLVVAVLVLAAVVALYLLTTRA